MLFFNKAQKSEAFFKLLFKETFFAKTFKNRSNCATKPVLFITSFFKIVHQVTKCLSYFWKKICCRKVSKFALSGQTAPTNQHFLNKKCFFKIAHKISLHCEFHPKSAILPTWPMPMIPIFFSARLELHLTVEFKFEICAPKTLRRVRSIAQIFWSVCSFDQQLLLLLLKLVQTQFCAFRKMVNISQ